MITGSPKFNAITLALFSADFTTPTAKVEAKVAFVDSTTGHTHGWTTCHVWSPATMAKLKELRALMEEDVGNQHFVGGSVTTGDTTQHQPAAPAGGLGEHLGSREDATPL